MDYYALFYDVVDDFVARRAAYREEHFRLLREAHRRGELLLAGAFTDPADRALLVFRAPGDETQILIVPTTKIDGIETTGCGFCYLSKIDDKPL